MLALLVALGIPAGLSTAWGQVPAAGLAPPKGSPAPTVGKPEPPAEKPSPVSIPVPEVARRAEDIGKEIRDLETLVVPGPDIQAIEKRLPKITAQISAQAESTGRMLDRQPGAATLDDLTSQWQTTRATLAGDVTVLTERATAIEKALRHLTGQQETWTRARADARVSRAPAPVIERIDGVLAAVDGLRTRLQAQRAATLVLQDSVAQEVARCEAVLVRLAELGEGVAGRLFRRDSVPLWETGRLASAVTELPRHIRNAVAANLDQLRWFARDQGWTIPVQVALFLGLALLMRAARRSAPRWVQSGELTPASARAFDRPVSAALVLTLLVSGIHLLIAPARAVAALASILALVPALRVTRLLLDRALAGRLYVLGAFFLTDLVRNFASSVPLLEQPIFLLEMLGGMVALTWWLASRPPAGPADTMTDRERARRLVARAVLVTFAAAFVAGAAGNMSLALLLGAGVLGSGYVALVLYAGFRIANGLVQLALHVRPLRSLGMVRRHRPLLERRAHGLLRGLAIAGWAVFALRHFGLWRAAAELTEAALGAHLQRGSLSVSLGDVLVFAVTAGAAFLLSGLVRFALEEDVYPRLQLGRGLAEALSSLLHYGLVLVGFLLALASLGVDLTKITILAGAFGVGIGFGLQTVVNNFVSGLLIVFERRIDVGDAVQIGEAAGRVERLGMRACTVRTWEGAEVIVPNANLITEKVTNWTLSDPLRRIDVGVGVAYGTPPEKMLDILLAVARAHPRVLPEPAPVALLLGFGDSALRFEMRAWTNRFDLWVQTQSELAVALYAALGEAGFEIPFPQHEVRLRRTAPSRPTPVGPTSDGPGPPGPKNYSRSRAEAGSGNAMS